ncbi:hypothetical protein J2Z48_002857 [Croceifilum oryzae]|uniref:Uncharacterized protein n=1 Tax=Croceifilum oryzae TaxID=1553429 RepID=A0AAJ1TM16_9BACL|nr:hypothetical protein [Croceifilum oryzae]
MCLTTAQIVSLRGCEKASPLRPSPLRASGKTRKERSNIATKRPSYEELRWVGSLTSQWSDTLPLFHLHCLGN